VSTERGGCLVAKNRGMPCIQDKGGQPHPARIMRARHVLNCLWLVLLVELRPGWAQKTVESACTACHDQSQKLQVSAHAAMGCGACHKRHERYPHPGGIPKPSCGQCHSNVAGEHAQSVHGEALKRSNAAAPDCGLCHGNVHELRRASSAAFYKAIPDTCGMCHAQTAEQYRASLHGRAAARGVAEAPVCTTCHGEHSILSPTNVASPVHPGHIRETCGQCHGNVQLSRRFGLPPDRIVSFATSFHGVALEAGRQTVANCASCHGVHLILPSSDSRSTINPRNLPSTCGKCHPGSDVRFALGPIHASAGRAESTAVRWVRYFYLVVIPLTVGLMLLHNSGDWAFKLIRLRRRARVASTEPPSQRSQTESGEQRRAVRMHGFERLEHAFLIVCFTVLAWTGFALRYPDGWWARPLSAWEAKWPVRATLHHIAAAVFMALVVTHILSLIGSQRLRRHWLELRPRMGEFGEGLQSFALNLGLRSEPPRVSVFSHVEKIEYWAVAWGAAIMIVTGLMLWAHNFVLTWLPKSALDVAAAAHFYEAVLAVLTVLIWHFYAVIFDPEVYPMDTAWLTGRSSRRRGDCRTGTSALASS